MLSSFLVCTYGLLSEGQKKGVRWEGVVVHVELFVIFCY
jgi:hypothetical protein